MNKLPRRSASCSTQTRPHPLLWRRPANCGVSQRMLSIQAAASIFFLFCLKGSCWTFQCNHPSQSVKFSSGCSSGGSLPPLGWRHSFFSHMNLSSSINISASMQPASHLHGEQQRWDVNKGGTAAGPVRRERKEKQRDMWLQDFAAVVCVKSAGLESLGLATWSSDYNLQLFNLKVFAATAKFPDLVLKRLEVPDSLVHIDSVFFWLTPAGAGTRCFLDMPPFPQSRIAS